MSVCRLSSVCREIVRDKIVGFHDATHDSRRYTIPRCMGPSHRVVVPFLALARCLLANCQTPKLGAAFRFDRTPRIGLLYAAARAARARQRQCATFARQAARQRGSVGDSAATAARRGSCSDEPRRRATACAPRGKVHRGWHLSAARPSRWPGRAPQWRAAWEPGPRR